MAQDSYTPWQVTVCMSMLAELASLYVWYQLECDIVLRCSPTVANAYPLQNHKKKGAALAAFRQVLLEYLSQIQL